MLVAYLWLFTWSDCVSDGLRLQCKRLAESGSGGFLVWYKICYKYEDFSAAELY